MTSLIALLATMHLGFPRAGDSADRGSTPAPMRPQTGDKGGVDPEALELPRARQALAETHRHADLAPPCLCERPLMLADEGEPACARCGRTSS